MIGDEVAVGRFPAQEQSRGPAGCEVIGMMILGTVCRPGVPWFYGRVGDLQFRLTPRPQGLQDVGVCLFSYQPLGSTAIRPIEKGKSGEEAGSIGKTVNLQ